MANTTISVASGTARNVFTGDVDLVMIGPVEIQAAKDTLTLSDVSEVYWVLPSFVQTETYTGDVTTGTVGWDQSQGLYTIGNTTGTMYLLTMVKRKTA